MECRSSGEPVQKWCAEHQTSTATYYRWEREILGRVGRKGKENQALVETAPEFTEIQAVRSCNVRGQAIMTLRAGTVEVDIHAGAGVGEIEAVCRVLKPC